MERPKKLDHKRRKKKATSSETIEEEHDAGKGRELERITAKERRNEPRPDTERDCHDEDDEVEENQVEENGENGLNVEEENCEDLSQHFGDVAREEENVSDGESGDDIWDDEKIPDPLSSDEDEEEVERRELLSNSVDSEELLALGKTFACAADFKLALLRYSLKTRYDIKMYKSTSRKMGARCSDVESNCPWRIYCSYEPRRHKMQVKVYINEHNCMRSGYSKMLKVSSIAWLFAEMLRINRKFTKKEMAEEVKREYNLIVTKEQCAKAKSKLFRQRKTSHEVHFSRIWDYEAEIKRSNQYTSMVIEIIPGATLGSKQRFDRLYVCFTSQREFWIESCRPIIGLDGAFLKWDIKGHLLAAVGRDGDNRIVPIAWAVVEIENNVNWEWFVKLLKSDLGLQEGATTTIISDKQKVCGVLISAFFLCCAYLIVFSYQHGLVNAVKNELPEAEHRMCSRHILANWKRDNKDLELERLFWKIAGSYTLGDYQEHMDTLKKYCSGAFNSLQKTNPNTRSRVFFRLGSDCNDNLNNLSESFNKTIREARKKPLSEMLEDIRRQCMVRNAKRAIIASHSKTKFTKKVHLEVEKTKEKAKDCIRYMACGNVHEIDDGGVAYSVDMDLKTCGCLKWQLRGIPCIHASCVITAKKLKMEDSVSKYYTSDMWRVTYSRGIRPVQGMKLWPRMNRLPVLPPPYRLGNRGRPSNYDRKKGANESSSSSTKLGREKRMMTCSNCLDTGHNKTTCSNPTAEREPKRPRGRPRLQDVGESTQGFSQEQSQA
ncbi:uncharacterized protein LOC111208155 [Brassica napus]|uniref:uncharacterized protein LOC111208155 n=1 Tax=Brassica napus TaxID=3708 RepID=UPI000BBF1FFA|nr:uncharacterized protein LOC111208155 [Brassica napus]